MPRPSNDKSTEGMGVKHHFKGTWGVYDMISYRGWQKCPIF